MGLWINGYWIMDIVLLIWDYGYCIGFATCTRISSELRHKQNLDFKLYFS